MTWKLFSAAARPPTQLFDNVAPKEQAEQTRTKSENFLKDFTTQ